MRTTLNLDDEALMSGPEGIPREDEDGRGQRGTPTRRRRLQEFLEFEGKMHWKGDLDQLRGRKAECHTPEEDDQANSAT